MDRRDRACNYLVFLAAIVAWVVVARFVTTIPPRQNATAGLAGAGLTCPAPQITTDTSNFVAGGTVSVSVTCVTSLADVSVPGVPGSKTLTATAVAHIDEFRTVGGAT